MKQQVDAVMHQIEFGQKHQKTNFGLNMSMGLLSHWIHGGWFILIFLYKNVTNHVL